MKKYIILAIFISGFNAYAQQSINNVQFERYSELRGDSLNVLISKRKYPEAIYLSKEWLAEYDKLDAASKKTFYYLLGTLHYNNACMYSLLKNSENAVHEFEKAIETGYKDYGHIKIDTDLDFIRNEKRFVRIMEDLRQKYDYLVILKQAREYNYNDHRGIIKFTYKSQNDSNLVALRNRFKLDSIAGTGNEISKILNILHWVHNTFPHDGTKEVPRFNSALELMNNRVSQNGTLHCGALAWVLEDCYLSLGYKARRVICFPKDTTDMDCHSINTVFSVSLNKWIWVDPTNDAYVMDEKGTLLGISEVRDRLTEDKPLILNPEANWNHRSSVTKEEYLYNYMAKNLYIIQCFVAGGGESKSNVLVPAGFKGDYSKTSMNKPKYTSNPNIFWANPY